MSEFTAKDIAHIIRTCKDSGVNIFDFNGLKLTFFTPICQSEEDYEDLPASYPDREFEPEIVQLIDDEKENQELDELMLSDIVEYEKRVNGIS